MFGVDKTDRLARSLDLDIKHLCHEPEAQL